MDNELVRFRDIIARIFAAWVAWPSPEFPWKVIPVMDDANGHYLLLERRKITEFAAA